MIEPRHLNAIDALHKIAALTSAALFLNQGNEEEELAIELLDIVLKTARQCMEADNA